MTENNKYSIEDLIATSTNQQPLDFEHVFGELMVDKIQAAVNDRKIQIAQSMYSSEEDFESEYNSEEDY
jgi:hypothetical protein